MDTNGSVVRFTCLCRFIVTRCNLDSGNDKLLRLPREQVCGGGQQIRSKFECHIKIGLSESFRGGWRGSSMEMPNNNNSSSSSDSVIMINDATPAVGSWEGTRQAGNRMYLNIGLGRVVLFGRAAIMEGIICSSWRKMGFGGHNWINCDMMWRARIRC